MKYMRQMRLLGLLLRPSLLSLVLSFALIGLVLGMASWPTVADAPIIYDYLSFENILTTAPDNWSAFVNALLAKPLTYNISIVLVSIVLGMSVYLFLESFERGLAEILGSWLDLRLAGGRTKQMLKREVSLRMGVRAASLFAWFVYWFLFVKVLLPFSVLAFRSGTGEWTSLHGWKYMLFGAAMLFVGLHMHVIFLRLVVLRPRVFGGGDVVAAGLE